MLSFTKLLLHSKYPFFLQTIKSLKNLRWFLFMVINVTIAWDYLVLFCGFPVTHMVRNLPAKQETWGRSSRKDRWIQDLPPGRYPGGGHGQPLQCSWLENPMDRGAWRATVRGVTKSWTQLSDEHFFFLVHMYVHSFFRFFSNIGYYRILNRVPCAIKGSLLTTSFTHSSVYMLIPNS